jgi:hypothetical protein
MNKIYAVILFILCILFCVNCKSVYINDGSDRAISNYERRIIDKSINNNGLCPEQKDTVKILEVPVKPCEFRFYFADSSKCKPCTKLHNTKDINVNLKSDLNFNFGFDNYNKVKEIGKDRCTQKNDSCIDTECFLELSLKIFLGVLAVLILLWFFSIIESNNRYSRLSLFSALFFKFQEIIKINKRLYPLFIFADISILFLVTFFHFQYYDSKILTLDTKWLILSGVPILIGLIVGGYITKIRFSNFELEIKTVSLSSLGVELSVISFAELRSSMKGPEMTEEQQNAESLGFYIGKERNYYGATKIQEFYSQMTKLKYFHIVNSNNNFSYLIPISCLFPTPEMDEEQQINAFEKFIVALEGKNIKTTYQNAVKDHVLITDNIIEAYRKFDKSRQSTKLSEGKEILPVLNKNHELIGTIDKQTLETKIAEIVIKNID